MDGFLSISMNQHKEICGIQMGGKLGLKKEQINLCKKLAFNKVLELTERIRQVVTDYYQYVLSLASLILVDLLSSVTSNPSVIANRRSFESLRQKMNRRVTKIQRKSSYHRWKFRRHQSKTLSR